MDNPPDQPQNKKRPTLEQALKKRVLCLGDVFAGMLDTANPNSEFSMMENEQFFYENLMQHEGFVDALKSAASRGIRIKILLSSTKGYDFKKAFAEPAIPGMMPSENQRKTLYNQLVGAYAFGGTKNLVRYIQQSGNFGAKESGVLDDKTAYDIAKSFEKEVLGWKKPFFRVHGLIGRVIGAYEKIQMPVASGQA